MKTLRKLPAGELLDFRRELTEAPLAFPQPSAIVYYETNQFYPEANTMRICFNISADSFYGIFYPCKEPTDSGMILMLGDSCSDTMVRAAVRWFNDRGCHVMALSQDKLDPSLHSFPLERIGRVIEILHAKGARRIGFFGMSATAQIALTSAIRFPEISLTIALSPNDYILEGYLRRDGRELPADGESVLTWEGKPLPYLPYVWRGKDYWENPRQYARQTRNLVASKTLFDLSEQAHPMTELERIPVEKISGRLILAGARDDCMWDTCKYMERMQKVLAGTPGEEKATFLYYDHGTHFLFPQTMLNRMLPICPGLLPRAAFRAAREFPNECRQTRLDLDETLTAAIKSWQQRA